MNGDIDFSGIIGKALEDPEMLSRAVDMAKTLSQSGLFSDMGSGGSGSAIDDNGIKSVSDGEKREDHKEKNDIKKGQTGENKDRLLLLEALKPYVPFEKREKIDLVIKLVKIAYLAKSSGLSL